ncbi:MAG: MBL fold metallo-hydrolase [Clostridia bacterium]|nr:MBL fold metallo-hydrolase [Clostridia bacterium]
MLVTTLCGGALAENCYIAKDEATGLCALVDPGFVSLELDAAVQKERFAFILLTHGHFDHAGAAAYYCRLTGAPLVCTEKEAALLTEPQLNLSAWFGGDPLCLVPDRTVRDGEEIAVGKSILTVMETPGHTARSCCYRADSLLFAGDTLMAGSMGRTDFPTGDGVQMRSSLKKLRTLPDNIRVYSGHGSSTTIGYEKQTNVYLCSL